MEVANRTTPLIFDYYGRRCLRSERGRGDLAFSVHRWCHNNVRVSVPFVNERRVAY